MLLSLSSNRKESLSLIMEDSSAGMKVGGTGEMYNEDCSLRSDVLMGVEVKGSSSECDVSNS